MDPLGAVIDLALRQDDVVLINQARALGLSDRRCRALRHTQTEPRRLRGALVIPPVRDPPRTAARMAVLSVAGSALCGATAARLHGLAGLPYWQPTEPVHLVLPEDATRWQRSGLRLHWNALEAADRTEVRGLPVTSVPRTLKDVTMRVDRVTALALADSALRAGKLGQDQLAVAMRQLTRTPGGAAAAQVLALADGRSESASESAARLLLTDAGLPPDLVQHRVRDADGIVVARLDLGYRQRERMLAPLGLEVDSAFHDLPRAVYRDRFRQNALVGLGWTMLRITASDVATRPRYVVHLVRTALGEAR